MRSAIGVLLIAWLLAPAAPAELLPEALGEFTRTSAEPYRPPEAEIFVECGLEEAERAVYQTPAGATVHVTAQQFADDTGAFAAFQWVRPPAAEFVEFGERGARLDNHTWIHFGNYLVEITGAEPDGEVVELMLAYLPRVRMTPDPPVARFVPDRQRVPNSEKHILGPLALERVAPEIPPSVAGFHFGTEAQYALFDSPSGEHRLLVFNYPSGQIANSQIEEFYQLGNVVAKRSGPLIAVVPGPPSPDEAERILSRVRYEGEVTLNEPRPPQRHDNLVNLLIDIILLCLILAGLMILGGVLVAVTRMLAGRYAPNSIFASSNFEMTRLNIDDR